MKKHFRKSQGQNKHHGSPGLSCLHNDADLHAKFFINQMMVHGSNSQERADHTQNLKVIKTTFFPPNLFYGGTCFFPQH